MNSTVESDFGNKTFYKPGYGGNKAVQLRAAQLPGEYRRAAMAMDRELGFQDGEGTTLRKLQRYPQVLDLCCGAYGEVSDGVKRLLDCMAESRIRSLGLRNGSVESNKELGLVTGYLRRRLSTAIMKANVKCLLERLLLVGEGQGQAGKRRQWARREEEKARWDREAQWLVRVTLKKSVKNGRKPSKLIVPSGRLCVAIKVASEASAFKVSSFTLLY